MMDIKNIINKLEESIIALLLTGMTLLVFAEVVMRFVFNTGALWLEEVTLHLAAWMVLFGASWGVKVGAHIGVDAIVRLLNPMWHRIVSVIAVIACLAYCALFGYGAWNYLKLVKRIGIELEDVPLEKWQAHSILLIGMVLISLRFLQVLWDIITGKVEGLKLMDEAEEVMHEMHIGEEFDDAAKAASATAGNGETK